MAAFWELNTCRQIGFGVGPIPWDKMVDYAQFHGLEDDVARAFVQIIRQMDGVYLIWKGEEMEAERKAAEDAKAGGNRGGEK